MCSNFIFSEDWYDVEDPIFDEGGASVVIIKFKLPVASSCEGDVMSPLGEIELIEVILEDQFGRDDCQKAQEQDYSLLWHRYVKIYKISLSLRLSFIYSIRNI